MSKKHLLFTTFILVSSYYLAVAQCTGAIFTSGAKFYSNELYNLEGLKIYMQAFDCEAGVNEHSFKLPAIPKGTYLVQVSDMNHVQIQRIML